MDINEWQKALSKHPDKHFANYILSGLTQGFRIGFCHAGARLQQVGRNMPCNQPQIVSDYLQTELKANRLVVLSPQQASAARIHCSPNKPGKWRLIVDLSSPTGTSVNDGVDKDLCSLSYTSIDVIANRVLALGKGSLLAKMDIKQAYRMVPMYPEDRRLLGMQWQGAVYVDKTLPFGLRSAPIIFSAVADALQWMMRENGITFVEHYIDDFITVGKPKARECAMNAEIMHSKCQKSDTPIEVEKSEGPSTVITFLGIEINSKAMELRLPAEKLQRLQQLVSQWRGKKACKKQELQSIVGSLSYACKVVKPGRAFIRRLIDLCKLVKKPHHSVRLSLEARSDLEWWHQFIAEWNGISMLQAQKRETRDVVIASDASSRWGCGAFWGEKWFQLKWSNLLEHAHITIKELIPIVLAAAIWGKEWQGLTIQARCDNSAVVSIINWGNSQDAEVMHLIRCLAFIKAKFQFMLLASQNRE